MTIDWFQIISTGIAALIAGGIGNLIFKKVKGGVHIPFIGRGYQKKHLAFICYFVSVFVSGAIFGWLQESVSQTLSTLSVIGIFLFVAFFILIWNHLHYYL